MTDGNGRMRLAWGIGAWSLGVRDCRVGVAGSHNDRQQYDAQAPPDVHGYDQI